jgi:hypothetical protein
MNTDYLKERKELVSVAVLGFSAVLAIMIIVKISSFFGATAEAEGIVTTAIEQNTDDANDIDKYFAKYKVLADALKKNNLFAPAPPKQNPVSEISGIFGDEVIIGDKLYKVGDRVADATIVAIGPTEVTIEWDGRKQTFSPMDSGGSSGPGGQGGPSRGGRSRPSGGSAPMVTIQSQPGAGGGPGGGVSAGIRERFENMSEDDRQRFRAEMQERRERYMRMSEAERERFRAEMRERFGGRPPFGRPGGGRRGGR